MDEDTSIDSCFDYFRRKGSGVDVLWVKEQIYRTSCVPETCPPTRTLCDVLRGRRHDQEEVAGVAAVTSGTGANFRFK